MQYELRDSNNTLVNIIVLDNPDDWPLPVGHTLTLIPETTPSIRILTQLAFLRRFTTGERISIRASSDPIIMDFLHLLSLAQDINLDDSDTVAGTHYLEAQGLLAAGRASEILT